VTVNLPIGHRDDYYAYHILRILVGIWPCFKIAKNLVYALQVRRTFRAIAVAEQSIDILVGVDITPT